MIYFSSINPFPLISIPQINWGKYIIAVKTIKTSKQRIKESKNQRIKESKNQRIKEPQEVLLKKVEENLNFLIS